MFPSTVAHQIDPQFSIKIDRKSKLQKHRAAMEDDHRPWANLHPDLLSLVSQARGLSLEDFTSRRAVCSPWRSTMVPATPLLIYSAATHGSATPSSSVCFKAAFCLPTQRSLEVRDCLDPVITKDGIIVGSGHGWLAIYLEGAPPSSRRLMLMNPISAMRIRLPELMDEEGWIVKKMVFAPNPRMEDFTAVAIYGEVYKWRLAYARSGDKNWTKLPETHDPEYMNTITDLV
ncbi:hypothetical protein BS78_K005000 [Paspalum vaginatum]|uniref:KIB1-4 beta-propeller domain-containing protein n=1 Tax=Paspalum vaginatum TaxID=158149 RepID=A0A9W8CG75_9POAL|nr:hypothetical protein BS78_K005000 [Paspalum vaginatum]